MSKKLITWPYDETDGTRRLVAFWTPRDWWDASHGTYSVGDDVKYSTTAYVCILQHTADAAKAPGNTTYWTSYGELWNAHPSRLATDADVVLTPCTASAYVDEGEPAATHDDTLLYMDDSPERQFPVFKFTAAPSGYTTQLDVMVYADGQDLPLDVVEMPAAWAEDTITWNNMPEWHEADYTPKAALVLASTADFETIITSESNYWQRLTLPSVPAHGILLYSPVFAAGANNYYRSHRSTINLRPHLRCWA